MDNNGVDQNGRSLSLLPESSNKTETVNLTCVWLMYRRVAEIQIFEKTYLIVIKDETGLKFKMNDSTLFLIGSYAQKLVASY